MTKEKTYMLQLGRHPALSRAELAPFCDEVSYLGNKNWLQVSNLKIKNPRNLPKGDEQLFIDRLGGVVAVAVVVADYETLDEAYDALATELAGLRNPTKLPLSLRFVGIGNKDKKKILADISPGIKSSDVIRWLNPHGTNLEFGRIFNDKVVKKGLEIWIYGHKGAFGMAKLVSIQNLRNYTLRDHKKPFRDAHMGMLPPKLAQILINLADVDESVKIVDPFCGSGTILTEAAVIGYEAEGSDLMEERVEGAKLNVDFLSEKFRFDKEKVSLETADAKKREYEKDSVIVTEGFLGNPYSKYASADEISQESELVLRIWGRVISKADKAGVSKIVMCAPTWRRRLGGFHSISQKLLAQAARLGYDAIDLFGGAPTTVYARPDAFVGREVIVLVRQ